MDPFDPQASRQILEGVFTLAGGAVAAAIIAAVIQLAKGLPRVGPLIDAGREYVVNLVLSAVFVAYAALAVGYSIDLVSGFGLFLAWLGLAGLTAKAHDAIIAPVKARVTG